VVRDVAANVRGAVPVSPTTPASEITGERADIRRTWVEQSRLDFTSTRLVRDQVLATASRVVEPGARKSDAVIEPDSRFWFGT